MARWIVLLMVVGACGDRGGRATVPPPPAPAPPPPALAPTPPAVPSCGGTADVAARALEDGDEPRAVTLARCVCDHGELRGCALLGSAYWFGLGGLGEDRAQAVILYRHACDGGDDMGCVNLAAGWLLASRLRTLGRLAPSRSRRSP